MLSGSFFSSTYFPPTTKVMNAKMFLGKKKYIVEIAELISFVGLVLFALLFTELQAKQSVCKARQTQQDYQYKVEVGMDTVSGHPPTCPCRQFPSLPEIKVMSSVDGSEK